MNRRDVSNHRRCRWGLIKRERCGIKTSNHIVWCLLGNHMEITRRMRKRNSVMVTMNNIILRNGRKGRFLIVQIVKMRRRMRMV